MFAQRAFEIGWEGITFVNKATDLANPATFSVLWLLLLLWFGLYVVLVIVVCQGWLVRQHLGIEDICDKHRMRAKVDALGDAAGQIGVGVLRDVKHMVDGTVFGLTVGEFVHLAPRLEAEVFKDEHGRFGGQHADIEHTRVFDEVMCVVSFVDRHGDLQRVARDLNHRIDDAAIIDIVVIGRQDIETVTDIK